MKRSTTLWKGLAVFGLGCGMLALSGTAADAHFLTDLSGTANCQGFTFSAVPNNLVPTDFVDFSISANCTNPPPIPPKTGTITGPFGSLISASGVWSLSGNCSVTGTATLHFTDFPGQPEQTTTYTIPMDNEANNCPKLCTTGPQNLLYNVSEKSGNSGQIVWFNSHIKLQGTVPTSDFIVNVTNQTITFGPETLPVPDAQIIFTSSANCSSIVFNTTTNQWVTTIPLSSATKADEIFSAALAFMLPVPFPSNVNNVTWNATFTSSAPSLQMQFQYGAANYLASGKGNTFPVLPPLPGTPFRPDYNSMLVKPVHNAATCGGYSTGDHAGTPENPMVKSLVTGGGSGGGGSNWTGSWSSTPTYICK